jgi:sulfur-carrier protein adenylyltransferase/sulfurtransferase
MQENRYNRQIILPEIGENGQQKLGAAKVLVIGAGGLSSAILPYLAAAGVGKIGIIDDDTVDVSNLQRQVLYKTKSVGKLKVSQAKKSLIKLNSNVIIETFTSKFNANNAIDLCESYDVVVDATDDLKTRFLINDACCATNKPLVYGSVYKFEGQVAVFNYRGSATYRCLFDESQNQTFNCNEVGVLGTLVGTIGMFQANEVLKIVLEIGVVLSDKIMIYNALNNEMNHFEIQKKNQGFTKEEFQQRYFKTSMHEISVQETILKLKQNSAILLDVREAFELPKIQIQNYMQIPLAELNERISELDKKDELVLVCRSGVRSTKAIQILHENGFKKLRNLTKGAQKLQQFIEQEQVELI